MSHQLFELDVRLKEIKPPIWRTIEVPGSSSLEDVHFAIQVAMGWTNSHLHQFVIGGRHYGMADVDDSGDLEIADEREYRLQDLVKSGASFAYEYDFGDGWEHEITVQKVGVVTRPPRSRCVSGARACPPEDCGGSGGYARLLEVLADPDHEEHESLVAWSSNFKPEHFVLPKAGLDLRSEMGRLKALADGEESFEQDDDDFGAGPVQNLPKPLVEAVLALPPMARASLAALIAGSLADEVEHARSVVDELATAIRAEKPARHSGRAKRARS
jgi:hypothetical protein